MGRKSGKAGLPLHYSPVPGGRTGGDEMSRLLELLAIEIEKLYGEYKILRGKQEDLEKEGIRLEKEIAITKHTLKIALGQHY